MRSGFLVLFVALLSGCASLNQLQHHELKVGAVERSYQLFIPTNPGVQAPYPLLLAFHGGGSDGRGMEELTRLADTADAAGMLLVYADGIQGRWNDGRGTSANDDLAYVANLVASVRMQHRIDMRRIYAVGMGSGGVFALRLACEAPESFAAVAGVLAALPEAEIDRCKSTRAMPVMLIGGTEDPLIPWDGGRGLLGADDTFAFWARHNGCGNVASEVLPVEDIADTTRVIHHHCTSGAGAEVVLYEIRGGGHNWPRAFQYLPEEQIGKTTQQFDANAAIVEFLGRFRLP